MRYFRMDWILSTCLLAACAAPAGLSPAVPNASQDLVKAYTTKGNQVHIVDVSRNHEQTPASMVLNIGFAPSAGFKTQAASGGAAKDQTNVSHLEVFLYEMAGGVKPSAATCPAMTAVATGSPSVVLKYRTLVPVNLAGGPSNYTQTVVFNNLPPNTNTGDKYFIGVRALESGSANITTCTGSGYSQANGTFDTISVPTSGPVALAVSGNSVSAAPNYTLSPLSPQSVTLQLLGAFGASIDANVTVTTGSTTLPGISAQ